jgi:hypothetical protein
LAISLSNFGCFAIAQTRISGAVCEENPRSFPYLATVPRPTVIDCAKTMNLGQDDVEFFLQLPSYRLLWRLAILDAAARQSVKQNTCVRVDNFRNEKSCPISDHAKRSLSYHDFHGEKLLVLPHCNYGQPPARVQPFCLVKLFSITLGKHRRNADPRAPASRQSASEYSNAAPHAFPPKPLGRDQTILFPA